MKTIKTLSIIIILMMMTYGVIDLYCKRIDSINNNPEGYTSSGRNWSIKLK